MIRRPPRSTLSSSSAASDVYKRQRGCRGRRSCGRRTRARSPSSSRSRPSGTRPRSTRRRRTGACRSRRRSDISRRQGRVLTRLDLDAVGRAGRLAHVAGHAGKRAVLARLQDVSPAEALRVLPPHLGVLNRRQALHVREVFREVAKRAREALEDLREVETLEERGGGGVDGDDACGHLRPAYRSSSPAMMFSKPSVATASDTMLPLMIFSNAAKSGKHGGLTLIR